MCLFLPFSVLEILYIVFVMCFCRFRFSVEEGICSSNIIIFVCVFRMWSQKLVVMSHELNEYITLQILIIGTENCVYCVRYVFLSFLVFGW